MVYAIPAAGYANIAKGRIRDLKPTPDGIIFWECILGDVSIAITHLQHKHTESEKAAQSLAWINVTTRPGLCTSIYIHQSAMQT